ncbi:unnamed protein product [Urochloa humidicola]
MAPPPTEQSGPEGGCRKSRAQRSGHLAWRRHRRCPPPSALSHRSVLRTMGATARGRLEQQPAKAPSQRAALGCGGATWDAHSGSPAPTPRKAAPDPRQREYGDLSFEGGGSGAELDNSVPNRPARRALAVYFDAEMASRKAGETDSVTRKEHLSVESWSKQLQHLENAMNKEEMESFGWKEIDVLF